MARTFTRTITSPAAARMVRPPTRPIISFVTDFGSRDPSAGIMHAVVLGIAADADIIDISHEVEKYRVRDGALLMWCAAPYLPIGAHVAVVDPGVGTDRRGIAMETARGDHLVGPDNGILLPAAARLGGIVRVHQLDNPQYRLPLISSSFHGRDVFAPAAAHLAIGVPLEFLGPAIDPRSLRMLDWPEPQVFSGALRSSVIYLDSFGNVKLSALGGHLVAALGELRLGERLHARISDARGATEVDVSWVETFGRVAPGEPLLFEDSYGRLSLAVNQGSAVRDLGIREDAEVLITRVPMQRPVVPEMRRPTEAGGPVGPGQGDPTLAWTQPVRGSEADPADGWGQSPMTAPQSDETGATPTRGNRGRRSNG